MLFDAEPGVKLSFFSVEMLTIATGIDEPLLGDLYSPHTTPVAAARGAKPAKAGFCIF